MIGCRPLTITEVKRLKKAFAGRMKKRNLALFIFGANTGFRISELLSLKVGDVLNKDGGFKSYVKVSRANMKSTGKNGSKTKSRTVILNKEAKGCLLPWLHEMKKRGNISKDDFLFHAYSVVNKPISRVQAWHVLKAAYGSASISGNVATHTMRKTFADRVYTHFLSRAANGEMVDPIKSTMEALGQENINTTIKYLSFKQEDIELAIKSIQI